ncbi:MAG: hypothetical protein ABJZ55_20390 [Fuerstiella sp.]
MARAVTDIGTPRDDIGLFFEAIDLDAMRRGYIGMLVAPIIESVYKRGRFSRRDVKQVLKSTDASRTASGGYNRVTSRFDEGDFSVKERGLEERVDMNEHAENLGMIDSELVAAEATRHGVLEDHELRVIQKINSVAVAETLSAGDKWSNDAADVVKYFARLKRVFRLQCGVQPNCMVIDESALDVLAVNPSVIEAAGRVGSSVEQALEFNDVNRELRRRAVAIALGLQEIIVSKGIHNTAGEPLESSLSTIFPEDKAVLMVKSAEPTTRHQQWLRTVHWSAGGSRPGCAFEEYVEPQTKSNVIRHLLDTDVIEVNREAVMVLGGVLDLDFFAAA